MGETKSHIFINNEINHPCVAFSNFKIIGSNFQNLKFKRKIAESLLIRETQSSLNMQDVSITCHILTRFSCNKEYVFYSDDGFWKVLAEI